MAHYRPGKSEQIVLRDFSPDLPLDTKGIILDAQGCFPSMSGYRPIKTPVPIGDALPHRPLGTYLAYYSNDTTQLFAATDNGSGTGVLYYVFNFSNGHWTNITGPTVNPSPPFVSFAQFGDDVLTVGNFDHIYVATGMGTTFNAITGSPANVKSILSVSAQVLAFEADNWHSSAAGDDTSWTPDIATLAASGKFYDAPGPVIASAVIFRRAISFKKNTIFLGEQSGPPTSWSWELISGESGTWGEGAVVQGPDFVAFIGMDDFWMITGHAPQRIPNNLKEWFFRNVNGSFIDRTQGWFDDTNSTIYWHFISNGAPQPPTCDMFVSYNVRARRWCVGHQPVSSIPYLGIASTQLPLPTATNDNIFFDGNFKPNQYKGNTIGMNITTGYFGNPARRTQLERIQAQYNIAPTTEQVAPLHVTSLGQIDTVGPVAAFDPDTGWHYADQDDNYHRFILTTTGDSEVTGYTQESRSSGVY